MTPAANKGGLPNGREVINIELQVYKQTHWINRSLLYWARTYDNLKSGQDYSMLLPAYHIGILDFTLFENHPAFPDQQVAAKRENT